MDATDNIIPKTSLSAGELIRDMLLMSGSVTEKIGDKIFPVSTDRADLPYIIYRRTSLEPKPNTGMPFNDEVTVEVVCFSSQYGEGVELAECVRDVLDQRGGYNDDLRMRGCTLVDSEESWENDAFIQQLVFSFRIESMRKN